MKKIVYFLLSCILITACSDDNIPQIPMDSMDEGFKSYLLEHFDLNNDGSISVEEAALVTEMHVDWSIHSTEGLEFFPNLEVFICQSVSIETIDISKNTKLKILNCSFTNVSSINASNNPALKVLDCSYSGIQELDVSNCHALDTLICENHYNGVLKSFKLNPELKVLKIKGHGMALLDFSGNQHLKELSCNGDYLIHLDISNSAIEALDCYDSSKLAYVNLEGCTKLKKLACVLRAISPDDIYSSLYLADCKGLEELVAGRVNTIDLSNLPLLKTFDFFDSKMANLDLSNNPALANLKLHGEIETIDFGNNKQLVNFEI